MSTVQSHHTIFTNASTVGDLRSFLEELDNYPGHLEDEELLYGPFELLVEINQER